MAPDVLHSIWSRAAEAKVGIAVKTNMRQSLRVELYRYRSSTGGFENLLIHFPPDESELWIINKEQPNADAKAVVEDTFEEL